MAIILLIIHKLFDLRDLTVLLHEIHNMWDIIKDAGWKLKFLSAYHIKEVDDNML